MRLLASNRLPAPVNSVQAGGPIRSLSRSLSSGQYAHGKILSGLFVCISGKHSRGTHKEIQAEITDAGETNISNARGNCTTLVTTPQEIKKPTRKISDARVLSIPIVSEDWLAACLREFEHVDTSAYLLEGWPLTPSTGGTLCNPTNLYASGNEVRFFQERHENIDWVADCEDFVEPRGFLEVDFFVHQTGSHWSNTVGKAVRVTHLCWYTAPEQGQQGYDPLYMHMVLGTWLLAGLRWPGDQGCV
jgi:hypothetical protein